MSRIELSGRPTWLAREPFLDGVIHGSSSIRNDFVQAEANGSDWMGSNDSRNAASELSCLMVIAMISRALLKLQRIHLATLK